MKMFINILILPAEKLTFTQPNAPAPPARYGKVKVTGVRHGEYLLFSLGLRMVSFVYKIVLCTDNKKKV